MIGKTLQYYRKLNNFSQKDLEKRIQITRQSISKWENNKCLPDLDNLILLSLLYNCSLDDLLYYKKERLYKIFFR